MGKVRNCKFTQVLWGLMGLFLLNLSIASVDPYLEHIPEDLSINEQESIVEFVVEKVLGYENAIQENDDHDTEDHSHKKNAKIDLSVDPGTSHTSSLALFTGRKHPFPDIEAFLMNGFFEIDTPPPKI